MQKILKMKLGWALALFAFLDVFCMGAGMGVPFFNILFGLPVGVYLALRLRDKVSDTRSLMGKLLLWSGITSAFTVLLMAIIWLQATLMLFDPHRRPGKLRYSDDPVRAAGEFHRLAGIDDPDLPFPANADDPLWRAANALACQTQARRTRSDPAAQPDPWINPFLPTCGTSSSLSSCWSSCRWGSTWRNIAG